MMRLIVVLGMITMFGTALVGCRAEAEIDDMSNVTSPR